MELVNKYLMQIKKNYLFAFLSVCMISSAFAVIPMGQAIYSTGILRGIVYILRCKCNFRNNAFVLFLIICYLSSLHAGLWDYRIFVFTGLFLFITPIFTSKRIFIFRLKYIVYSLYMFPIVALISLYCYFKGINMMSLVEGDVSWDFSALFWHSMWLGAANGLSNIVLLWMIYKSSNKVWQVILILWLLCSIFLSVVSGSRSALFASLIAMSYLIYLKTINFKKLIQYIIIIGSILFVTIPFYYNYADRMVAKMEYQKENGETSRDEAFAMRVRDFKDSPIIGVGFAVGHHLETGKKEIGRMESGSGWLSVLSQTGILGSLVVIYVLFFAYKSVRKRIKTDLLLQLIVPVILFICVHSVFEGYILTAGYYMCIFFWGILGLLSVYPMYAKIKRPYK